MWHPRAMAPTRRQVLGLVPALAVGLTVSKETLAASMTQPKRCGGLDYPKDPDQWDGMTPMIRNIMRHAWRTGDKILSADDPMLRRIGFVAVRDEVKGEKGPVTGRWWLRIVDACRPERPEDDPRNNPPLWEFLGGSAWCKSSGRSALAKRITRWAELCRMPCRVVLGERPNVRYIIPFK